MGLVSIPCCAEHNQINEFTRKNKASLITTVVVLFIPSFVEELLIEIIVPALLKQFVAPSFHLFHLHHAKEKTPIPIKLA